MSESFQVREMELTQIPYRKRHKKYESLSGDEPLSENEIYLQEDDENREQEEQKTLPKPYPTLDLPLLDISTENPVLHAAQEKYRATLDELRYELERYRTAFGEYAAADVHKLSQVVEQVSAGVRLTLDSNNETALREMKETAELMASHIRRAAGLVDLVDEATVLPAMKLVEIASTVVITLTTEMYDKLHVVNLGLEDIRRLQHCFDSITAVGHFVFPGSVLGAALDASTVAVQYFQASLEFLRNDILRATIETTATVSDLIHLRSPLGESIARLDQIQWQKNFFSPALQDKKRDYNAFIRKLGKGIAAKKHQDTKDRRMSDSGGWIVQDTRFKEWLEGEKGTLWCQGKPGVGKTFLCSTIIDHCRDRFDPNQEIPPTAWVAWVYCDYSAQSSQTILQLTKNLIQQFCDAAYRRGGEKLNAALMELTKDFHMRHPVSGLEECFKLLAEVVTKLHSCTVIIDAFDECAETDASAVSRGSFLKTLLKLPIRLLVTSRDLPPIRLLFQHFAHCTEVTLETKHQDIRDYIHWRIWDPNHGSPEFQRVVQSGDFLQERITKAVTEKYTEVNFNIVQHQTDAILALRDPGTVLVALESLRYEEDKVYDQSIERIEADAVARVNGLSALAWVYAARRPLGRDELPQLLVTGLLSEWSQDERLGHLTITEAVIEWCKGLVVLLPESGTFAFAHPTVKEYLDKRPELLAPHIELIPQKCLERLILHASSDNPDFPLPAYASRYWFTHVKDEAHGQQLMPYWSQVIDRAKNPGMAWLKCHETASPSSLIEVACALGIRWLIGLLCSSRARDLRVETETALKAVAQFCHEMFPEMFNRLVSLDTKPSEAVVAATAAAGDHGLMCLDQIFSLYPHVQITRHMMVNGVNSNEPNDTLRALWNQHTRSYTNLRARPHEPLRLDSNILICAAENRMTRANTLLWLKSLGAPVNEEVIYTLARHFPGLVADWAVENNIVVSAEELFENIRSYGEEINRDLNRTEPLSTISSLLPRTPEFMEIKISAKFVDLVHSIQKMYTSLENFNWLFKHGKTVTATQAGARRVSQKFDKKILQAFLKHQLPAEIVLVALDELRRRVKVFDKMEEQANSGHPSDVEETLRELYNSSVEVLDFYHVLENVVFITPGKFKESKVDALLQSTATSLVMAMLELHYGKCTEEPEDVGPAQLEFFDKLILDRWLTVRNATFSDQFAWAFAVEANRYFRGPLGQVIGHARIDHASTTTLDAYSDSDIAPVLTYLAMKSLLVPARNSISIVETLIQVTIHNFHQIMSKSLFNLSSLSALSPEYYEAAMVYNGADADYVHSVLSTNLVERDSTWAPQLRLFQTAARTGSLANFTTLQRYNKSLPLCAGHERTNWSDLVLREAVQNTGDDCLGIVRFVLEERRNNDLFRVRPSMDLAMENERFGLEILQYLEEWEASRERELEDWWVEDDEEVPDWEKDDDEDVEMEDS